MKIVKLKFLWFLIFGVFFLGFFAAFRQSPPTQPTKLVQLILKKEEPITLLAVGDIMLGRSVNSKMRKLNDFTYPFLKTSDFLKSADLTFGNLESPLVSHCPTTDMGMIFCADPKAVEGLILAGIDIVNLANNHIKNYGAEGVETTKNFLAWSGISALGFEANPIIKEVKGTKFGFLGFDLTGDYQPNQILEKIKETKNKSEILIVSLHWGEEYAPKPNQAQINFAHQVIDAGADLILGHHPHVIQPTEEYKDKLIIYSLGNFIFDQPWSEKTKKGLVGIFTFQNKKLVKKEFKKVYIKDYCQPEFLPD